MTVQAQHRRANGLVGDVANAEYIASAIGPGRIPLSERIAGVNATQRTLLGALEAHVSMPRLTTPTAPPPE